MKGEKKAHQNGIGLANGPEIDLVILSAGDKHPWGLPANLEAVNSGSMRHEFLWRHTMVKGDDDADQLPWLMKRYLKMNNIYTHTFIKNKGKKK